MSIEDRRRFRVMHDHASTDSDYHEWVTIDDDVVYRDAVCRKGYGTHRWRRWICNNTDCPAVAYIAESAVQEIVNGWLSERLPQGVPDKQEGTQ